MDVDTREGPQLGDAFGATLLACLEEGLRPGTVREIVERDDGYLDGQDALILGRGRDPYATENPLHLRYHARNEVLGRMGGQIRIRIRYYDTATSYFDYLFATVDELRTLLKGTTWTLEEYEQDGPSYGVVLRKKER